MFCAFRDSRLIYDRPDLLNSAMRMFNMMMLFMMFVILGNLFMGEQ